MFAIRMFNGKMKDDATYFVHIHHILLSLNYDRCIQSLESKSLVHVIMACYRFEVKASSLCDIVKHLTYIRVVTRLAR